MTRAFPRFRAAGLAGVLALAGALWVLPGAALVPVVMLDAQWEERPARLVSLQGGVLRHYDGSRVLRERSTHDVVRLRFDGHTAPVREPRVDPTEDAWKLMDRMVWLTDGQRFVGRFEDVGAADEGQTLLWRHERLGVMQLPLERVSRIAPYTRDGFEANGFGSESFDNDAVMLVNGDPLFGFVAAVSGEGVTLETPDGAALEVAWASMRSLVLGNPRPARLRPVDVVRLVDGSVFHARGLVIEEGSLRLVPVDVTKEPGPVVLPLTSVASIDFSASGVRVVPLTALRATTVDAGEVFGLPYPPRVQRDSWLMHAPAAVEFVLPAPGRHVSARAELVLPARLNPPLRALTGAALRVGAGTDAVSLALKPEGPVTFSLPLSGDLLKLTLEPGPDGPMLDRVRLTDGVVLLSVPPDPVSAADP